MKNLHRIFLCHLGLVTEQQLIYDYAFCVWGRVGGQPQLKSLPQAQQRQ